MNLLNIASEFRLYLVNNWIAGIPSHHVRLFFYRTLMRQKIGPEAAILLHCWFDCPGNFSLGENSTINRNCRLDSRGGIQIGANVSISANVVILTVDHDLDSADFGSRPGPVVIEDYCFIGTGATILKGVHLGKGAVVGAGSVITRDVPAGEIWAGNPARKIRDRKMDACTYTTKYRRLFQ